jgi:PIN domain nuclease of toxin-antitoxin system
MVLDASALLAFLRDEPGADEVLGCLDQRPLMSAVNLAEVLTQPSDKGVPMEQAVHQLQESGILDAITVILFDSEDAKTVGALCSSTRVFGLSLGDRACLAVALRQGATVLTADQTWLQAPGVRVEAIRQRGLLGPRRRCWQEFSRWKASALVGLWK